MPKTHKEVNIKANVVWENNGDKTKRYIPLAYEKGRVGWGVWDRLLNEWADDRLAKIDPNERLTH